SRMASLAPFGAESRPPRPRRDGGTGRREALKSPRRLGLFRKWLAPPSQQWRRAARPATNALTRKGGADAGVPIDPFPRSRRGPPAPFLLRTPAPRMLRQLNRRGLAGGSGGIGQCFTWTPRSKFFRVFSGTTPAVHI